MKKVIKVIVIIVGIFVALIIYNGVRNYSICKKLQRRFEINSNSTTYFIGKFINNENQRCNNSYFGAYTKFMLVDNSTGSTIYRYYDKEKGIVREYRSFNENTYTENAADSTEVEHWRLGNVVERSEFKSFGPFMLVTVEPSKNPYSTAQLYKVRKFGDNENYDVYDSATGAKIEKVKNNKSIYNVTIRTGDNGINTREIDYILEDLERGNKYKLVK